MKYQKEKNNQNERKKSKFTIKFFQIVESIFYGFPLGLLFLLVSLYLSFYIRKITGLSEYVGSWRGTFIFVYCFFAVPICSTVAFFMVVKKSKIISFLISIFSIIVFSIIFFRYV